MAEWIQKKAQSIKDAETNQRQAVHRAEKNRQVIDEQWRAAWKPVMEACLVDVVAFNGEFPTEPARHITIDSRTDTGFTVMRTDKTRTSVIHVQADGRAARFRRILTAPDMQQRQDNNEMEFVVAPDGNVGLKRSTKNEIHTPSQAAQLILQGLFG